jgi:hypothetical protein
MQLSGRADILRPFIWSRVSDLMRFRDEYDKGTALSSVQISVKAQRRPCND